MSDMLDSDPINSFFTKGGGSLGAIFGPTSKKHFPCDIIVTSSCIDYTLTFLIYFFIFHIFGANKRTKWQKSADFWKLLITISTSIVYHKTTLNIFCYIKTKYDKWVFFWQFDIFKSDFEGKKNFFENHRFL